MLTTGGAINRLLHWSGINTPFGGWVFCIFLDHNNLILIRCREAVRFGLDLGDLFGGQAMTNLSLRTLLVPTDFSEGAAVAVEYALWLAARSNAHVLFLHVMQPTVYSVDFALTYPDISVEVRERSIDALRQLAGDARSRGISADEVLGAGTPFVEINRQAAEHKADLIVMGTHGRTGLAHVVLGSTAERVVRLAPCPVLTVKAAPLGTAEQPELGHQAVERGAGTSAGR
jgi:nucleotide-binding universal stress UspA family protein